MAGPPASYNHAEFASILAEPSVSLKELTTSRGSLHPSLLSTISSTIESMHLKIGVFPARTLTEVINLLIDIGVERWSCRIALPDDCSLKTFRDRDPSPFASLNTGTKSVRLKGKSLDLDDEGQS